MERFRISEIGVTEQFPKFGAALTQALFEASMMLGLSIELRPNDPEGPKALSEELAGQKDIRFKARFVNYFDGALKVIARQCFIHHREKPLDSLNALHGGFYESVFDWYIYLPINKGWFPTPNYEGHGYAEEAQEFVYGKNWLKAEKRDDYEDFAPPKT